MLAPDPVGNDVRQSCKFLEGRRFNPVTYTSNSHFGS